MRLRSLNCVVNQTDAGCEREASTFDIAAISVGAQLYHPKPPAPSNRRDCACSAPRDCYHNCGIECPAAAALTAEAEDIDGIQQSRSEGQVAHTRKQCALLKSRLPSRSSLSLSQCASNTSGAAKSGSTGSSVRRWVVEAPPRAVGARTTWWAAPSHHATSLQPLFTCPAPARGVNGAVGAILAPASTHATLSGMPTSGPR